MSDPAGVRQVAPESLPHKSHIQHSLTPIAIVHRAESKELVLPALATAHSHAFQRGLRGLAQRRMPAAAGNFWSWRSEMYHLADSLTPESFERIACIAYQELARAGVRTVGEFHYVHHQADGVPYAERTLLADIAIRAAKAAGLRIALLRAAYFRAGAGLPPEPGQARFCDPSVDAVLRDVDDLRARYAGDPDVRIGLAPHSIRAVAPGALRELADYASRHGLPLHMHVAEQSREVAECRAETGRRPGELLADLGVLSPQFVAVHATQLESHELKLLGQAGSFVCVCPTTERDLGDGLSDLSAMRAAGVRLCTGVDSHVVSDPFEEMRALETHERLRTRTRVTFAPQLESPSADLWAAGSLESAAACGFEHAGGRVVLDAGHPTLALVDPARLLDAVLFSGHPGLVKRIEPLS
jgi:formimidoylglutamate deiminase